jgi:hypothetical protein
MMRSGDSNIEVMLRTIKRKRDICIKIQRELWKVERSIGRRLTNTDSTIEIK